MFRLLKSFIRKKEIEKRNDALLARLQPSPEQQLYQKDKNDYYPLISKIEQKWSVMYNLGDFTGDQATDFEAMCGTGIRLYINISAYEKAHDIIPAPHCPAFVRLVMLYEKQNRFDEAISVCSDAIRCGADADSSKGGMRSRLARLYNKADRPMGDEALDLIKGN